MKNDKVSARLVVKGRVQGVWYRLFTQRKATGLGLTGWVRNRADGSVEVAAEGPRGKVEALIATLESGPPLSQVEEVEVEWEPFQDHFRSFEISY